MRRKSRLWLRRGRWLPDPGNLRSGAGRGNPDRGYFPSGGAAVPGSLSADWLWLRLLPALSEEEHYEYCRLEITEDAAGDFTQVVQNQGISCPAHS